MSHPVRVRGLKLSIAAISALNVAVAPRAGAWIETCLALALALALAVAPRAGAWIETICLSTVVVDVLCRTPCGCVD